MHYDAREAAESHKCMPDKCMPENITEQNHRRNDKKKKNFSYCELKVKNINISKHTPYLTCTQWHMYGRTESFFFFFWVLACQQPRSNQPSAHPRTKNIKKYTHWVRHHTSKISTGTSLTQWVNIFVRTSGGKSATAQGCAPGERLSSTLTIGFFSTCDW